MENRSWFHEKLHAANASLLVESTLEQTVDFVRYSEVR